MTFLSARPRVMPDVEAGRVDAGHDDRRVDGLTLDTVNVLPRGDDPSATKSSFTGPSGAELASNTRMFSAAVRPWLDTKSMLQSLGEASQAVIASARSPRVSIKFCGEGVSCSTTVSTARLPSLARAAAVGIGRSRSSVI